jgi:hypothetical protein
MEGGCLLLLSPIRVATDQWNNASLSSSAGLAKRIPECQKNHNRKKEERSWAKAEEEAY